MIIRITKDNKDLIEMISYIHVKNMPGDVISRLGYMFLQNIFYPAIFDNKHCVVFVDGNGFVIMSFNHRLFKKELSKKIFWRSFLFTLFTPSLWLGAAFAWFNDKNHDKAEIELICVDKKGAGIGSKLLDECKKLSNEIYAKTSTATEFYLKNGFKITGKQRRGWKNLDVVYYKKD